MQIRRVIDRVADDLSLALRAKDLKLEITTDNVTLAADFEKLRIMLDNLMSNAIKFSPPGGTIAVAARVSGPYLEIDVADQGPGIPHADRAHIFDPFYQGTQAIYALHAFSLLMGIVGAATVVGAFLTGWPSIIAVILNYVKRGDVRGTWLESHFRWQIRTFWYGLLWVALCGLFVIFTLGLGIFIVWLPIAIVSIWFVYRIVRGWARLASGQAMTI